MLANIGFVYVWEVPLSVNPKNFITIFKQRLIDNVIQQWSSDLRENKVLSLYKEIKPDLEYEHYLDLISLKSDRKVIVQIHLSAHNLHIQTG